VGWIIALVMNMEKKSEFGPATVDAYNITMDKVDKMFVEQDRSRIVWLRKPPTVDVMHAEY